jgi:hypothetical protein
MWRLCEVFFVPAIQLYTMRRALSKAVHRIIHTFGHTLPVTKGIKKKIDPADRTPRETLEKRLEETPSNARCFAQGFP